MHLRDRQILQIALPSIVSNITVPLLGLVDVSVVGHLGSPAYIGAIAVGGMLFNVICWVFAFLRMGTSGMTSQALGRRDLGEVMRLLVRSVSIGLAVGLCFVALQVPVRHVAFWLVQPTEEVIGLTATYYHICIWGVPAMLGIYGLSGWYIGMQNSRIPMVMAILQNVTNIVVTLLLVYGAGMKVAGVATGTVVAQYVGLAIGLLLWRRYYGRLLKYLRALHTSGQVPEAQIAPAQAAMSAKAHDPAGQVGQEGSRSHSLRPAQAISGLWDRAAMVRFFRVNRDIFLRTLCLVAVTMFFTSAGAAQGEVVLAVNTLLMQFFMLYSFVMDGFAYAGEALSGRFIGAGNRAALTDTLRRLFGWGLGTATVFTLAYWLGGDFIVGLLTDEPQVAAASTDYSFWTLLIPVAGMAAFIWDGIFIGATATRGMLLSMACAAAAFFLLHALLRPVLGNHGLWIAFLSYLFLRGVAQTLLAHRMVRKAFSR